MTALRILHVEDEPDIREVVQVSLGLDPDFVTRSCGSGQEALSVAEAWPPDIILLDVMMPAMDGPTTLAHLRDNKVTAQIPVVFMTARAQSRELEVFRSLGAVGVIRKPFDPMTLAALVRAFVRPAEGCLNEMRNRFAKRIASDAAALIAHRTALKDKTVATDIAAIGHIAHRLAGAGGIFGFQDVSDAASALDEAIKFNDAGSPEDIARALDELLICLQFGNTQSSVFPEELATH